MAYMAVVRSPHAHARLTAIDPTPPRALPRGLGGLHRRGPAADDGADPVPHAEPPGPERLLQFPLAPDRVRCAGEPVPVVAARDRYLAEDAAGLEAAIAPGAYRMHDGAERNVAASRADARQARATEPIKPRAPDRARLARARRKGIRRGQIILDIVPRAVILSR